MTILHKKLAIAFFIASLTTVSMAADRDEDSEEELNRQLVTLQVQNEELKEAREKELKKAHLRQQIEEEKQRAIALSSSQPQYFQTTNPLQDFTVVLHNTAFVGIQSICDKATGQDDQQAPSKWVPVRKELKQQAVQTAVSFLSGFLNSRTTN
jgi:hypothetical protein